MGIRAIVKKSDIKKMTSHLIRNVRYGATVALTKTAIILQKRIIDDLPRHFTIRSRWVPGSIKFLSADKGEATPTAIVGTVQDFMAEHETGGERQRKKDPGERRGVPLFARKNRANTTRPSQWPEKLFDRNTGSRMSLKKKQPRGSELVVGRGGRLYWKRPGQGARYFTLKKSGGNLVLMQRLDKAGKKLRAWYFLARKVHIHPEWHFKRFEGVAINVLAHVLPKYLTAALTQ